uniref:hypothetical protein n=1 Tax=uncultured Draconibacterium sp. TaxID=1573823 RepID=UPI0032177B6C
MKNLKINLSIVLSLFCGSVIFTSCDDDDPKPKKLEAYTDAYIQKTIVDDEEKTALAFFVQANKELKSVTVKVSGDEDTSYTLTASASNKEVFLLIPGDDDFSTDSIGAGNYEFSIESTQIDDEILVKNDSISNKELATVTISATEFAESKLKTTWETVADADGYVISLANAEGTVLFNKGADSAETDLAFGTDDNGWLNSEAKAEIGTTYTLNIMAVLYEEGATELDKGYNVQYISKDKKEIVWGE